MSMYRKMQLDDLVEQFIRLGVERDAALQERDSARHEAVANRNLATVLKAKFDPDPAPTVYWGEICLECNLAKRKCVCPNEPHKESNSGF